MSRAPAPSELLAQRDHRPWPLPRGPWVMRQTWLDLLFAHWPFPPAAVAPLIPPELELDRYDGHAWVGVVPFRMEGVRVRALPPLPGTAAFEELNVRTYVRHGDRPGVWFFSLDAASRLAVSAARTWFHLPYFRARMRATDEGGTIAYASERTHPGAPAAELRARYGPTGPVRPSAPGTLERWLTERYCLYARSPRGTLYRGEIHHPPWPLQPAQATLDPTSMLRAAGLEPPGRPPLLHYANRLDVLIWPPKRPTP